MLGLTQASMVMPVVSCSVAEFGIVTIESMPLNTSAWPYLPTAVHVALLIVPVFACPDRSLTRVPVPSSKEYAPPRLGLVDAVVAVATLEYGPRLPAASCARTM